MGKYDVSEIKGVNGWRAFNGFNALLMGYKQLPNYAAVSYEAFYKALGEMQPREQEDLIRRACFFVNLESIEMDAMLSFVKDKNGVPIGAANVKNLKLPEIMDMVISVCMEFASMKIDMVSDTEKKN